MGHKTLSQSIIMPVDPGCCNLCGIYRKYYFLKIYCFFLMVLSEMKGCLWLADVVDVNVKDLKNTKASINAVICFSLPFQHFKVIFDVIVVEVNEDDYFML